MRHLLVVITLLIANNLSAQKVSYGNNKAAGHYLNTRGFKMYYEVYGSGKPLLFIHGNGG